ncbi:MAG: hypothetical protein WA854_14975 [Candidatus Binataceae bacterium]|jgi:hypothetical protein
MTVRSIIAGLSVAVTCAAFAGCSAQQPVAASQPAPIPVIAAAPVAQPVKEQPDPLMQDWNIFPDPTSGKVEVYHDGAYVGAVTGDEPGDQDPPLPHKTAE